MTIDDSKSKLAVARNALQRLILNADHAQFAADVDALKAYFKDLVSDAESDEATMASMKLVHDTLSEIQDLHEFASGDAEKTEKYQEYSRSLSMDVKRVQRATKKPSSPWGVLKSIDGALDILETLVTIAAILWAIGFWLNLPLLYFLAGVPLFLVAKLSWSAASIWQRERRTYRLMLRCSSLNETTVSELTEMMRSSQQSSSDFSLKAERVRDLLGKLLDNVEQQQDMLAQKDLQDEASFGTATSPIGNQLAS